MTEDGSGPLHMFRYSIGTLSPLESFHSRFRDECLAREILLNLHEARVVIEEWRQHYNREQPHSKLGYLSPEAFINNQELTPQGG